MSNTIIISKRINQIPLDVIREVILPFSYNIQKRELLQDIRCFYTDYNIIDTYYSFDFNYSILFHDLKIFCLNKIHIILSRLYCYDPLNKSIFNCSPSLIEYGLLLYCKKDNNNFRRIRQLLSLLTPIERTQFINKFIIDKEENLY